MISLISLIKQAIEFCPLVSGQATQLELNFRTLQISWMLGTETGDMESSIFIARFIYHMYQALSCMEMVTNYPQASFLWQGSLRRGTRTLSEPFGASRSLARDSHRIRAKHRLPGLTQCLDCLTHSFVLALELERCG